MNELALFAGAGGGILGGKLLGWRTVCAVEIEPYPASILIQRQNDGILPPFPIWDDVCTFDGTPWRGFVDVVSGGFPCQDISVAGKGEGISGKRSGLWKEMARIISEVQPKFCFIENSSLLRKRGLDIVLSDLAQIRYNAEWCVLGGSDCGAPHKRKRMWILADSNRNRLEKNSNESGVCKSALYQKSTRRFSEMDSSRIWATARPIGARPMGMDDGVGTDVDRIKAVGNGQIPIVAATAWNILMERLVKCRH